MEPSQGEYPPSAIENEEPCDTSITTTPDCGIGGEPYVIVPKPENEEPCDTSITTTPECGIGGEPYEIVHKPGESENVQSEALALRHYPGYSKASTIKEKLISFEEWIEWIFLTLSNYTTSLRFRQSFTVGILTYSEKDECKWLKYWLQSPIFKGQIDNVQVICYSEDIEGLKKKLTECSYILFYHRGPFGSKMTDSMIASTVRQTTSKLEKKNMMIALGHLKNKKHEDEMKNKLHEKIGKEYNQLLFTRGEIEQYENLIGLYPWKKLDQIKAALSTACGGYESYRSSPKKHTIGIASRSSESDFEWLAQHLKNSCQADVRYIYISNNGRHKFWDDVSHCTFAILYHTKKRLRINITDVTDSLYDEQIKYLSSKLGKDNVIVVVDDLDNSSNEEKERILQSQPSIGRHAKDLILFTQKETDPNYKRLVAQQIEEDEINVKKKLDALKEILGEAKATMMSGAADTTNVHRQEETSNILPLETNEVNETE
ncbi:uncharacterized protein LOC495410 [Xenopus laevis]|uniref:LOC495410 protein n=1 Tax=Xenopus laevis TaxID=8355 RepID=Q5U4Z4_XENLA|nr:uncharacterized protein LOC495410 [Xenopus laevis]AAH84896.1 LOC495410 protein [Xenopus laevis]